MPSVAHAGDGFVEMFVRHAKKPDAEVILMVPRSACFADVKRSLARPVGDQAFMRRAQLVRELPGARRGDKLYSAFRDESPIRDIREVVLLGADLSIDEEVSDDEDSEEDRGAEGGDTASTITAREVLATQSAARPAQPNESRDGPASEEGLAAPALRRVLERLAAIVEKPEFQRAVSNMSMTVASNMSGVLLRGVWRQLAGEFGYEDDDELFRHVVARVHRERDDPEVQGLVGKLEELFRVQAGSLFATPSVEQPARQRAQASEALLLSRERLLEVLEEYETVCGQPQFASTVQSLHRSGGFFVQLGLTQLMGRATAEVAQRLGLGGAWSFEQTVRAIAQHRGDPTVGVKVHGIEQLMRCESGKLFGVPRAAAGSPAQAANITPTVVPQEVHVLVRHATDEGIEVFFKVPPESTMLEVRRTLAEVLNRPEILERGQLVEPTGTGGREFTPYRDEEKLRGRSELLFVGTELVVASPSGSDAELAGKNRIDEEPSVPPAAWDVLHERVSQALAAGGALSAQVVASGGGRNITRDEVLELQRELREGFGARAFQQSLRRIERESPRDPARYRQKRVQLCLTVQSRVLPKYGFEGAYAGVVDMMTVLVKTPALNDDPQVRRNVDEINSLLEVAPKQLPSQAPSRPPAPTINGVTKKAWVTVKHALDESISVKFAVLIDATVRDVRETLADTLGRPEIRKRGRLVRRFGSNGTVFESLPDAAHVGDQRVFLVLGVDDFTPAAAGSQAKPAPVVPAVVSLNLEQALTLQQDLISAFSSAEFQRKLAALQESLQQRDEKKFSLERQQLFLSVQSQLLPNYGFSGDMKGVLDMLGQFERQEISGDTEVQRNKALIDAMLFGGGGEQALQQGGGEQAARKEADEEPAPSLTVPEDVEVRVRWCQDNDDVADDINVVVPSGATMRDVKIAVSRHLGSNGAIDKACFIKKQNGTMFKYDDDERLGLRRRLLLFVNS